jgi:hypothetical protein
MDGNSVQRRPRSLVGMAVILGLVSVFAILFYYTLDRMREESEARAKAASAANKVAVAAGFSDSVEMEAAKREGYPDATMWRAKLAERNAARKRAEAERMAQLIEESRPATELMDLHSLNWEKGGFGSVAIVSLTITNKNTYPVRDIAISCQFDGNSGTTLSDLAYTIYDVVPAKGSKRFNKLNIGFINSQSARGGCHLATAKKS